MWGATHYHSTPSHPFDDIVSWAHQHTLNAETAGEEESPGKTICIRHFLPSLWAEQRLLSQKVALLYKNGIKKVPGAHRETALENFQHANMTLCVCGEIYIICVNFITSLLSTIANI